MVAYFGKNLSEGKLCYNTYDIEFYVVVQAIRHWRHYLFQQEFILFTYHDELKHLNSQEKVSYRHVGWIAFLQQFTFVIKYKSSALNKVVNALSRRRSLLSIMCVEVQRFNMF